MADPKLSMEKAGEDGKKSVSVHVLADSEDRDTSPSPEKAIPFDQKATRTLLRKLDFHLVPFLALLYLYLPPNPSAPVPHRLLRLEHLG
jgi:hypothetical protein